MWLLLSGWNTGTGIIELRGTGEGPLGKCGNIYLSGRSSRILSGRPCFVTVISQINCSMSGAIYSVRLWNLLCRSAMKSCCSAEHWWSTILTCIVTSAVSCHAWDWSGLFHAVPSTRWSRALASYWTLNQYLKTRMTRLKKVVMTPVLLTGQLPFVYALNQYWWKIFRLMAYLQCHYTASDTDSGSVPATLYYAEHVHIAQTHTLIPTPYFFVGQESVS